MITSDDWLISLDMSWISLKDKSVRVEALSPSSWFVSKHEDKWTKALSGVVMLSGTPFDVIREMTNILNKYCDIDAKEIQHPIYGKGWIERDIDAKMCEVTFKSVGKMCVYKNSILSLE